MRKLSFFNVVEARTTDDILGELLARELGFTPLRRVTMRTQVYLWRAEDAEKIKAALARVTIKKKRPDGAAGASR